MHESWEVVKEKLIQKGVTNTDWLMTTNSKEAQDIAGKLLEYYKTGKKISEEERDIILKECIENPIFFFREIYIFNTPEFGGAYYTNLPLNVGTCALLFCFLNNRSCILCNPRQSVQSGFLKAIFEYLKFVGYDDTTMISGIYTIKYIISSFNTKYFDKIGLTTNTRKSDLSFDFYDKTMLIDDFEFTNTHMVTRAINYEHMMIGVGVINKNIDANIATIIDSIPVFDYSMYDAISSIPKLVRFVPNVEDIYDVDTIEKLKVSLLNDKEIIDAEIFRTRKSE